MSSTLLPLDQDGLDMILHTIALEQAKYENHHDTSRMRHHSFNAMEPLPVQARPRARTLSQMSNLANEFEDMSTEYNKMGHSMPKSAPSKPSLHPSTSVVRTGSENIGRWTEEEHDLFLKGLEKYGKHWKNISSLVTTRTVVQIRTHAQKYFRKLEKSEEAKAPKLRVTKRAKSAVDSIPILVPGEDLYGESPTSMDDELFWRAAAQVHAPSEVDRLLMDEPYPNMWWHPLPQ